MKQVYIYLKAVSGEALVSADGYVDFDTRTLFIPRMSTKGHLFIDEVKFDNFFDQGDRYIVNTSYKSAKNGKTYYNNYTLFKREPKQEKKGETK